MITKLGVFLRKIRIENNENMKDMAYILGVSSSFLSAVENGKKTIPSKWPTIIKDNYNLDYYQIVELYESILESQPYIVLDTLHMNKEQKRILAETASSLLINKKNNT